MSVLHPGRASHAGAGANSPCRRSENRQEAIHSSTSGQAALRKARRYTDAAGGKFPVSGSGARKRHQASSYKQKCPGCGSFDHVYKDCYYRSHPYFNKDPSIEYARSPVGIRYHNTVEGRYIKERDLDPTLAKNDRGASMQRKRSQVDDSGQISEQRAVGIAQLRSLSTQSRRFLDPS